MRSAGVWDYLQCERLILLVVQWVQDPGRPEEMVEVKVMLLVHAPHRPLLSRVVVLRGPALGCVMSPRRGGRLEMLWSSLAMR